MKTIFILTSFEDKFLIDTTNNLEKTLKSYNKKIKVGKLVINEWDLVCHINFENEKRAEDFKDFLKTDQGYQFIITHFVRNSLAELERLIAALPKSCQFYVIGGLAIDGYTGKISRMHNDADLMCWRKDINKVKAAIKKIGYKSKYHYLQDAPKKAYYIETDEENPIISFFIMDEVSNSSFEISVGNNTHQVIPKNYLGSKKITLNNIKFPVVSLMFLDHFNKKSKASLNQIRKENPKLYSILGAKINNNKHDRKILNRLIKE